MQSINHDPPRIAYSIREAVAATGCSKTWLYAMIASNRLRSNRVAGRRIIPADALHALIAGEVAQ
jgi:excisionase family DNA binding protein